MAYNAASHNLTGERTGPVTGQPPSLSEETASALIGSSENDPVGQSAPGRDGGDKNEGKKVKTEKELEKERQKAEKAKKFAEKQAKMQKTAAAPSKKEKKKVESKEEVLPEYKNETPKGQKKILKSLDDPYNKAYNPNVVESAWYDWWEAEGFFKPEFAPNGEVKEAGHFVIPVPPPNVTGSLHIGHALATTLQDTLIRWNRMKGLTTLYVPGCDHAGIATQTVVEKRLKKEGKTRHDLGRSAFVQRVQEWKGEYHEKITNTLKRLGGSFDWSREAFTMDENLSKAVMHTFIQLHEEGYIYRANKLVNWCTQLSTSISNLEVEEKELKGRTLLDVPGYERKVEFGVLTHFKYPVEGSEETIEVATTRVVTMLGDSGIAVHPTDKRYQHLIGKFARHPFLDRLLPIFSDEYVDPEFGTGCVKITPAHDPNDYALGKKHNLEFINIFTDNGLINQNGGKFEGQKRFDVRYTITKELTDLGLFVKKEDNPMKIPLCSRSKDVIEPRLKPQWWMRMPELANAAMQAVRDGSIKIRPEQSEKSYFRWMETIQDWCLSRQLWWGHQIPAYFVKVEGVTPDDADNEYWITAKSEEEARDKAAQRFSGKKFTLERDPDCLDTWFSSGLWPFSTLGWPSETDGFKKLFPTSVLETGWDILFFWVARMIMLSLKLTGKAPFSEVYCHSLVRDSENRKMSKSLGNVIDPIDVMEGIPLETLHQKLLEGNLDSKEVANATRYQKAAFPQGIPECGADALRFSLVNYTTGGGDIAFDIKTMHAYRRFCNKIYQATKYVLGNLAADFTPQVKGGKTGKESLPERWILHKLNIATRDINKALTAREFSRSTQTAYRYWYDELCDVYIENSKAIIQNGTDEEKRSAVDTLYTTLEGALLLIHPFMPFLSEELWQRLPRRPNDSTRSIMVATYPQYDPELDDPTSEAAYELILGYSKGIRSLIAEYGNKDEGKAFVKTFDDTSFATANREVQSIQSLSKAPGKGPVSIKVLSKDENTPTGCAVFNVSSSAAAYLEVKGRIDIETEIKKAQGKMKKAADSAVKQRKLLDELADKAGDAVIEVEKQRLTEFLAEQRNYEQSIEQFEQLKLEEKK